jgi:antitoxin (DNA-binding transcriptional repressor) of toxin-antitoxin stability system
MKTLNVRELRSEMPRLRELLAREHELLLVSNGETVARILPAPRKRQVQPLTALRAKMPMVKTPIETLLREDRDKR